MGYCLSKSSMIRRGFQVRTINDDEPSMIQRGSRVGTVNDDEPSMIRTGSQVRTINDDEPSMIRRGSQVRTINDDEPSMIRRDSQVRTVNDPEPSEPSIHMLPVEILQYISAAFLPADAAASLALCSRSMLKILGSQVFRSLRLECHTIEKTRFLKNLEKDLPDWLFCHHCLMFHPVDQEVDPRRSWLFQRETECAQVNGVVSSYYDFYIRYEYAQLIMRNYRLGRPYKTHLQRLFMEYSVRLGNMNIENVVTADIVEGELRIRIKRTLRLLKDWDKDSDISLIRGNLPRFCAHLDPLCDSIFAQAVRCRLSHANRTPCIECEKPKHCLECSTSYEVDIRNLEDLVTEVRVDVLRYLGSCESPFNSKWRAQANRCSPKIMQMTEKDQKLTERIVPIAGTTNEDDEDWEDIPEDSNRTKVLNRMSTRRYHVSIPVGAVVDIHLFI